jgi:hypothetical protein
MDYDENRGIEQLQQLAEERGCDLIVADDRKLLLDLDGGSERLDFMYSQIDMLHRNGALPRLAAPVQTWQSRSGANYHAALWLVSPLPLVERIALQTILGSDPVREGLAYARRDGLNPIVLFRPRI